MEDNVYHQPKPFVKQKESTQESNIIYPNFIKSFKQRSHHYQIVEDPP